MKMIGLGLVSDVMALPLLVSSVVVVKSSSRVVGGGCEKQFLP
jgi:hypothetical protein